MTGSTHMLSHKGIARLPYSTTEEHGDFTTEDLVPNLSKSLINGIVVNLRGRK